MALHLEDAQAEDPAEVGELGGLIGIERLVVEALQEIRNRAVAVCRQELFERGAGEGAVAFVIERLACGADDAQIGRDQPVSIERAERGQQHALGQIASGTEQQKAVCGKTHIFPT